MQDLSPALVNSAHLRTHINRVALSPRPRRKANRLPFNCGRRFTLLPFVVVKFGADKIPTGSAVGVPVKNNCARCRWAMERIGAGKTLFGSVWRWVQDMVNNQFVFQSCLAIMGGTGSL